MNSRIVAFRHFCVWLMLFMVVCAGTEIGASQEPLPRATPTPQASPTPQTLEKQFLKNILRDQKAIWTAPFHLRGEDAKWLVPLGASAAALIATDRRTSSFVSRRGSIPVVSRYFGKGGTLYATAGAAAAFYLLGRSTNNQRARETGLLAAEALIDSGIVTQALKFVTQRPRPNNDNGRGRFFQGGNSFPSGHATSAWSLATVIAYEYHNRPLIRYGAFAAAAAVSLSRYSGRNHFLSDVLVGSAIGYGIGRFVYHKHHFEINKFEDNYHLSPQSSKLIPLVVPVYEPHTHTYGGTMAWNF